MIAYRICEDCGEPHHAVSRWCPHCLSRHTAKCRQCGTKYDRNSDYDICKSCRSQLTLYATPEDATETDC